MREAAAAAVAVVAAGREEIFSRVDSEPRTRDQRVLIFSFILFFTD